MREKFMASAKTGTVVGREKTIRSEWFRFEFKRLKTPNVCTTYTLSAHSFAIHSDRSVEPLCQMFIERSNKH